MAKKLPRNIRMKRGKFLADKMINGKRYRKVFATLWEASAYLRDLEIRAAQGSLERGTSGGSASVWFREFLQLAKKESAPSTYDNYDYALGNLDTFLSTEGIHRLEHITVAERGEPTFVACAIG